MLLKFRSFSWHRSACKGPGSAMLTNASFPQLCMWGGRERGRPRVSVVTIIKVSSCRATDWPDWTLWSCLKAPDRCGAGAKQKGGSASCEDRLTSHLSGPMEASPGDKHHQGEVRSHPLTQVGDFPTFLLPLVSHEGRGAASKDCGLQSPSRPCPHVRCPGRHLRRLRRVV